MSIREKLQLRLLPSAGDLAATAASDLHEILTRRNDLSIPFGIALSGGRIARPFYSALVEGATQAPGCFENVHFFWADERCVPPSDPENNYAGAREALFEPLQIPGEQIHRIRGEVDPRYAVDEAEAEICRVMPLACSGQPILDLVILGMGEDGHVASLFPEEGSEWTGDEHVYRKVVATKPPPDRVTLGYQPIFAAREVWVLASGSGKGAAFRRLLEGDETLPVTRVVLNRPSTRILHDFPVE